MIDEFVVGGLVLGAIAYAATTLGPRHWRGRAFAALAWVLAACGLRSLALRSSAKAAAKSGGACGGCDDCGSVTAKSPAGALPGAGSNEVRVPLSKIGKRR